MGDLKRAVEENWNKAAKNAADAYARRRISIDPITRLEGHGRIEIILDQDGTVERAYFQVPELRGFEKFVQGRPAEDMPQITSRICGICPMAHHLAATQALDVLYHVEPPPAAIKIREMLYCAFLIEDHSLHFYFLGGPDFIVGPERNASERNLVGVIARVGSETARKVIAMRQRLRNVIALGAGKAAHPVFGLPGGVAKQFTPEMQNECKAVAQDAVEYATFTLRLFDDIVLRNPEYLQMITSDAYTHKTYYMGLVDEENRVSFLKGTLRIVSPDGKEWKRVRPEDYAQVIAEHVEPWSYAKFCYLKPLGWTGFTEGPTSSVYGVGPMARLNAADGVATEMAQREYSRLFTTMGGKPVHHTLANHWARLIEMLYAAERMVELANDPQITDANTRVLPVAVPTEGIGVVEAPRGTLIHHYETDERGVVRRANLIVATQNNASRIAMSVEKAARQITATSTSPSPEFLNRIEMAFRAYDPCLGCATHADSTRAAFILTARDHYGHVVKVWKSDSPNR